MDTRLLAAELVEHVLSFFERDRPDDLRPREAVAAARAYAHGEIGAAELQEARRGALAACEVYRRWPDTADAAYGAYAAYPVALAAAAATADVVDCRLVAFHAAAAACPLKDAAGAAFDAGSAAGAVAAFDAAYRIERDWQRQHVSVIGHEGLI